jgi:hypothetical protein
MSQARESSRVPRSESARDGVSVEGGPEWGDAAIRPIGSSALIGAMWACAMGLLAFGVPVLIGWALAPGPASAPADALRVAVHVWLAAHLVPTTTAAGTIGLLPLGFVFVPIALLTLVGRWAARTARPRDLPDAVLLAGAMSIAYALVAVAIGAWASTGSVSSPAYAMFLAPLLLASIVTTTSIIRCAGLGPRVRSRIRDDVMAVFVGGSAAVMTLVAGGAALAGIAFALQIDEATAVAQRLQPDAVGGVLLTIVCLGYVPNAAIWAASFAVGPGFAVGAGTTITPSAAESGALPAFPLLAALPADGPPPGIAAIAMLLPLLAAVVGGVVVARRASAQTPAEHVAGLGALAGLLGGVLFGLLAALSGGPLGDERLATLGPSAWRVALLASVALATVGAATSWAMARRRPRVIVL